MLLRIFTGFFLCLALLSGTPRVTLAQTTSAEANRLVLLEQIELLKQEVLRLQTLLNQRLAGSVVGARPHDLVFYDLPFEQIYFVQAGSLRPADAAIGVRPDDAALFALFTQVVGKAAVEKYIAEWRVFTAEREDIGAFVELIPETGKWVVGVNLAGYSTDASSEESFATLFLHEFAHIVLYELPQFTTAYTKKFWTAADVKHAAKAAAVTDGSTRFRLLQDYYTANANRFVSDYATLSSDEDLAETFVSFVTEERGWGEGVIGEKIRTFYSEPRLLEYRTDLRSRR